MKKKLIISISIILLAAISLSLYKGSKEYVAMCFFNTCRKLSAEFFDLSKSAGYKKTPQKFFLSSDNFNLSVIKEDKINITVNGKKHEVVEEVLFNYEYIKEFYNILKVKKAGLENVTLGKNDVECKIYDVIISKDDFKKFCQEVKTDKTYEYLKYKVLKTAKSISEKLGIKFSEHAVLNVLDGITPQMPYLYKKLSDDIIIKIYTGKNRVCRIYTSIDFEGIKMSNATLDIKISDGNKVFNFVDAYFSAQIEGKKLFIYLTGFNDLQKPDNLKANIKGAISYNHINLLDTSLLIETNKDEYSVKGSHKSSEKSLYINGMGNILVNEGGISFNYKNNLGVLIFSANLK